MLWPRSVRAEMESSTESARTCIHTYLHGACMYRYDVHAGVYLWAATLQRTLLCRHGAYMCRHAVHASRRVYLWAVTLQRTLPCCHGACMHVCGPAGVPLGSGLCSIHSYAVMVRACVRAGRHTFGQRLCSIHSYAVDGHRGRREVEHLWDVPEGSLHLLKTCIH